MAKRQEATEGTRESSELVVLVHGLARTPRSLGSMARALERGGYSTRRFGYPSLRAGIDHHAHALAAELAQLRAAARWRRIHLVGHSLGNLVVRAAVGERPPGAIGRIVMLVPPNRGSQVARWLAPWIGGAIPVLGELSDAPHSKARRLPIPRGVAVGVIAAALDHVVRESSTHLPGEADHVRLMTTHSTILASRRAQALVLAFLRDGRFPRS